MALAVLHGSAYQAAALADGSHRCDRTGPVRRLRIPQPRSRVSAAHPFASQNVHHLCVLGNAAARWALLVVLQSSPCGIYALQICRYRIDLLLQLRKPL